VVGRRWRDLGSIGELHNANVASADLRCGGRGLGGRKVSLYRQYVLLDDLSGALPCRSSFIFGAKYSGDWGDVKTKQAAAHGLQKSDLPLGVQIALRTNHLSSGAKPWPRRKSSARRLKMKSAKLCTNNSAASIGAEKRHGQVAKAGYRHWAFQSPPEWGNGAKKKSSCKK